MSLQIFKPNSKNTGHCAGFSFNSKEGALYVNFVKQNGFNPDTQRGVFKGGERLNVKFGVWEVGGFMEAFGRNGTFKTVHKTQNSTVSISAGPFMAMDDPKKVVGYSLSVSSKTSEATDSKKFSISFTPAERNVFLEYIRFFLEHSFSAIYAEDKKRFAAKANPPKEADKPSDEIEELAAPVDDGGTLEF